MILLILKIVIFQLVNGPFCLVLLYSQVVKNFHYFRVGYAHKLVLSNRLVSLHFICFKMDWLHLVLIKSHLNEVSARQHFLLSFLLNQFKLGKQQTKIVANRLPTVDNKGLAFDVVCVLIECVRR